MSLFKREARLIVGDIDASGLRFGFNVEKHLRKEPNTAKITVYNLAPERRKALEDAKRIPVKLEAGYEGETFLLFLGVLDAATTVKNGPDWVTTIYTDDGKDARRARGARSYRAGASFKKTLEDMVTSMGAGVGNLLEQIGSKLNIPGLGSKSDSGIVTKGNAQDTLERLLNGAGYTHSIQDGQLEVRRTGRPLFSTTQSVVLNRSSGLIDTPTVDRKGRIEARSLLIQGLNPGYPVKVQSPDVGVDGIWLVDSVVYSGDTFGADWYADIEGAALS